MQKSQKGRRAAGAMLVLAMVASACASAPPVGSRPAAFPGAPAQAWAATRDAGFDLAVRDILETAVSLRGSPYQFGGATPQSGFDCSGFVRYVFAQGQLDVPRTVADQYRAGHEVARSHIGTGDLVFFSTTGPGATHVGIVVDPAERTFVHAPGTGSVVRVERFDTPYWSRRMLGVRRLPLPARPTSSSASVTAR
jgi:cell wall-associated NlpC family hydrolase